MAKSIPYGYDLEVVHDETGEVVNSWFVRSNPPEEGPLDSPAGFSMRVMPLFEENADTKRLDWLLLHPTANFDMDQNGPYIVAKLEERGLCCARGATHRECIDVFLEGNATPAA